MKLKHAETLTELRVGARSYRYHSLAAAEKLGFADVTRLPYTLKIVLENLLRQRASGSGRAEDIAALQSWRERTNVNREIHFRPVRVMMDDTAGIPLIGDLAAMRDAMARLGGDPTRIDTAIPVDFIVDHSIIADHAASPEALARNAALEFTRNAERYRFLRWGERAFERLRVVPPGSGICHQINLEYLARVVCAQRAGAHTLVYPDSMVGIDSHTPMINSLGIVGWGVSGLEGLAAALGEPVAMLIPEVVGCRLTGSLQPGVTATDLVLTLTQIMRRHDLVGKFIEYCGPGLDALTLPDRATVANMTPESGSTMSFFPIDAETLRYLRLTGRDAEHVALVEAYARAQGLWRDDETAVPEFSAVIEIDLSSIEASISGPSQPHNRVPLREAPQAFSAAFPEGASAAATGSDVPVKYGDVVIAAITSCTNTSNPSVMLGAGILARNAVARGLKPKPWVKTTLSPGSRVVSDYLIKTGLQDSLDALGFQVTGYGCMTCVGFSGPLAEPVAAAIPRDDLAAAAVLSGNRNYEGRVHALVRASFLASPPLVVAYALAGSMLKDLTVEPLGIDTHGREVYLQDLWPDDVEVRALIAAAIEPGLFIDSYATLYDGSAQWRALDHQRGTNFQWDATSTVIRRPPLFDDTQRQPAPVADIRGARILAIFGDMVTTEHVSPMGMIPTNAPAARYLQSLGIMPRDFVSYAARRLNHDVMVRGTFASTHLHNEMTPAAAGGHTIHFPDRGLMPIFDAAERYRSQNIPLIVIAGQGYGTGSSRDWAAKGARLLGVRAVLAESFERIHRANLIAAGVLPLQFLHGETRRTLKLDGSEMLDITGLEAALEPGMRLNCVITRADGSIHALDLIARLDTRQEAEYFRHGGTLNYLLRKRCD